MIEAIIEQADPKRQLYDRLETVLAPHAIVATNTSGIPVTLLAQGQSEAFRRRFLGMHFFNPPRHLHLLELIPTADTAVDVLRSAEQFGERVLGKASSSRATAASSPTASACSAGAGVKRWSASTSTRGPRRLPARSSAVRKRHLRTATTGLDVICHVTAG